MCNMFKPYQIINKMQILNIKIKYRKQHHATLLSLLYTFASSFIICLRETWSVCIRLKIVQSPILLCMCAYQTCFRCDSLRLKDRRIVCKFFSRLQCRHFEQIYDSLAVLFYFILYIYIYYSGQHIICIFISVVLIHGLSFNFADSILNIFYSNFLLS